MSVSLPLSLEVDDVDGALGYQQLRLEPDIRNSGMGPYAKIIDWLNQGWSIAEYRHHYASNFGLGGAESDDSLILFEISFGTSAWASFWRLLLTLVSLQQTYRNELPVLPSLTFLDQVNVASYVVTLVAFVLMIRIGRRYAEVEEMEEGPVRDTLQGRLEGLDNSWPLVVVAFSATAIAICWMLIPAGA